MVFELHAFGPAFGLPSIDAECLAVIIYLQKCLPTDAWKLVASNQPQRNPFKQFPALRSDDIWVAGFDNITQYLRDSSSGDYDLDANLDAVQQADTYAFSSFLQSHGLPLLDLSLYVSSDNYTKCTRSAWAELLSWPESWTIPHQLREKSKKRSEHLGLSTLDVDAAQEKDNSDKGLTAHIPKSLRKPKQTISGLLGRAGHTTKFRLDAVTADFLEPLQEKLGGNSWLIGESITSADCRAIAYLALMQVPGLPQAWLRESLAEKYSNLGRWASTYTSQSFGPPISIQQASNGSVQESTLPWLATSDVSWPAWGTAVAEGLVSVIPIIRLVYQQNEVIWDTPERNGRYQKKNAMYKKMRNQQILFSRIVTACIGSVTVGAWLLYFGVLSWPQRRPAATKRSFGEAGMLLGLR